MIPKNAITAWRSVAPWASPDQVEHDLVLSRAICDLYSSPIVSANLAFRGGTALHKLFIQELSRFSEDLDFVQVNAEPIGVTIDAIREQLDPWLGAPTRKANQGRFTLNYQFKTEIEPIVTRKLKIEINTREHANANPYLYKNFSIENSWYKGKAIIKTYTIEELLATKLRALYQRKKGRDLYDLWVAFFQTPSLNIDTIISVFERYMQVDGNKVSRAEFEKNLFNKKKDIFFKQDILPLLNNNQSNPYKIEQAFDLILDEFVVKLKGDRWSGLPEK